MRRQYKLSESVAIKQAQDSVIAIARHFGGRAVYLPIGKKLELALRDKNIWLNYNGRNVHELVRKYHLSHQQIYNVIEKQRAVGLAKRQPTLPFDEQVTG